MLSANVGRFALLAEFEKWVIPRFDSSIPLRICVIGGSTDEPEVLKLKNSGYQVKVHVLGIDENCDLRVNIEEYCPGTISNSNYDLVICSQVLEHLWNQSAFFSLCADLTSEGALFWISCPFSNRFHKSPDFFASGFTPEYLINNLRSFEFKGIAFGTWGTKRNYAATHLLPYWHSRIANYFPVFFNSPHKNFLKNSYFLIRYLPVNILLQMFSNRVPKDYPNQWATETWVLFQKS
jgi:hypothetical protein